MSNSILQYQFIDLEYPGLRKIENPKNIPIYKIDDFLSADKCDLLISQTDTFMVPSPVVGEGSGVVNNNRTSTTVYLRREDCPTISLKICKLLNKVVGHLELPQVARYQANQEYKPHYDAFQLNTKDGKRFAENGGQRIATILIYLNDVTEGGCTSFSKLNLQIKPKKGMALVFFPATIDGKLDENAFHAAERAIDEKYVCQVWVRQSDFYGVHNVELSQQI